MPRQQQYHLERLKPDPIPAIHPLPEYLADGDLKAVYEETKAALQVPWMGVVTMAFAHYPNFYATLWKGLRPLTVSAPFVAACATLRKCAEANATTLAPPQIRERLAASDYAEREIQQIAAMIEVFSHGNMPYLLIATLARLLLEGQAVSSDREAPLSEARHAPRSDVPFVLMEPHHADPPTRAVYDDLKATLGLPFVNTDYRALARWPSYFAIAWSDLRRAVVTPEYASLTADVHETAIALVRGLPNPGALSPEVLRVAADADGRAEEIIEVVRLFQWLLPGLVVNVAYLRAQLSETPHATLYSGYPPP